METAALFIISYLKIFSRETTSENTATATAKVYVGFLVASMIWVI